jgi:hypothetical protein
LEHPGGTPSVLSSTGEYPAARTVPVCAAAQLLQGGAPHATVPVAIASGYDAVMLQPRRPRAGSLPSRVKRDAPTSMRAERHVPTHGRFALTADSHTYGRFPLTDGRCPLTGGGFPLTADSCLRTADSHLRTADSHLPRTSAHSRIPAYGRPIPAYGRFPLTKGRFPLTAGAWYRVHLRAERRDELARERHA